MSVANTTILLNSGIRFDPINPDPQQILIEDIAHALSNECRFSGHVTDFYSVAQHSVMVSYLVPQEDALAGLLHDASEAYITDVATPIKHCFTNYYDIEDKLMRAIAAKFEFQWPLPASVKLADVRMLATEKRDLMPNDPIPWAALAGIEPLPAPLYAVDPKAAKFMFMNRFKELVSAGKFVNPNRTMLVGQPNGGSR
jgi:hypothetical protein